MYSHIEISSNVVLEINDQASEEVKHLLANTIYGKKGGMQYRHNDARVRINSLHNPLFLNLRKSNKLLGTVTILLKNKGSYESDLAKYYFRYFSFPGSSKSKIRTIKNNKSGLKGRLKSEIKLLFEKGFDSDKANRKSIYYAYVEKDNQDSWHMCNMYGFEKIASLQTIVFSRFKPRLYLNTRVARNEDKAIILDELNKVYNQYSFYLNDPQISENDYFVYLQDGKPVAGVKAVSANWEVIHVPGLEGFFIQHILPRIPFVSKVFPFPQMKFIALEAAWVKDGREELLVKLIESVCALKKKNIAIFWSDSKCKVGSVLLNSGKLGVIRKLKKNVPADICAKFNDMNSEEIDSYYKKPVYISASDLI